MNVINFVPPLEQGPDTTFFDICNGILDDIYKQADQMKRIGIPTENLQTYEVGYYPILSRITTEFWQMDLIYKCAIILINIF